MQPAEKTENASRNNRRAVFVCLAALAVMGSITAASPLLYTMFCKATGYNGTTQRVSKNTDKVLDRTIEVRFDGNVSPSLDWKFEPETTKINVKIGETNLAFFRATNMSDKTLTGQAAFNVTPEAMGLYFKKIACFCFKQQTLKPHQSVDMPVTFFIDPKMVDDDSTNIFTTVTLSYVFFPVENPAVANTTPPQPEKSGG